MKINPQEKVNGSVTCLPLQHKSEMASTSMLLSKLILGTVQLGLPYGINNTDGQPSLDIAHRLLAATYRSGIRCLDTAEAYGNSQEVIGSYHQQAAGDVFSVITKYSEAKILPGGDSFKEHVFKSIRQLQVSMLDAYLFHNFDTYKRFRYWNELGELQQERCIGRIGVSVYTNEQAAEVANDDRVSLVQLPYNLLDNFSLRGSTLSLLKRNGKEVHVRSVFLQGLFYKDRNALGRLAGLHGSLTQLDRLAQESKADIGTLALAYCLRQPLIDRVLIGVETEAQLARNIDMLSSVNAIDAAVFSTIDQLTVPDRTLLNPTTW